MSKIIMGAYALYEYDIRTVDHFYNVRLLKGNDVLYKSNHTTLSVYSEHPGEEEKWLSQDIVRQYEVEKIHTNMTHKVYIKDKEYKVINFSTGEDEWTTSVYNGEREVNRCGWTDDYLAAKCYPLMWYEYMIWWAVSQVIGYKVSPDEIVIE